MRTRGVIIASSGLFLSIVALALASGAWAAPPADTFYVSPSGVDLASRDGSSSQPWRHIGYALSRSEVGGGDIIIVMDDGVEDNDDYVENVTVNKSVKIYGQTSNPFRPVVKALWSNINVFDVTMNGVEIKDLRIYGATSAAAIELNGVSRCLIEGNYCGGSSTRRNAYGVLVSFGYRNVVMDNFVTFNTTAGIDLWGTSGNMVYNNLVESNTGGIRITQDGSANIITFNVIRTNADSGSGVGLGFGAVTDQNVACGNIIEFNDIGIDLDGMAGGILAANIVRDNGVGLYVPAYAFNNSIFRNDFANATNIDSAATGYALGSSTPLFYRYQSHYFKRLIGNLYSDYVGSDANGDGIGDVPYSTANYEDNQPIIGSTTLYGWSLYHHSGVRRLLEDNFINVGEVVTLRPLINQIYATSIPSTKRWLFKGGSASDQTTWTGWLTFSSPPPVGHTVEVIPGISDEGGTNFEAIGPVATVSGDGTSHILHFTGTPSFFVLPEGKRLAVRLTNTGTTNLEMMVGAAASMIFAPAGSLPAVPLLPMLLLLE